MSSSKQYLFRDGAQSEEKLSKEARKGIGTTPIPFLMENHPPN
ncbi:Uncharacterised protein [Bacillus freudenreichii]|nr:Uncharacterised protein [Bacillus freudenreichii]